MKKKTAIKSSLRQRRIFSTTIRKQTVRDIEKGKCSISEASRELGCSCSIIYEWIYRYSAYLQKNKLLVVEDKSEAYKSKELEARIKELEAALGRKQMENELLNKIIDLANEHYRTDLKKSLLKKVSNGSESEKGSGTDIK
jgi:transposase